MTRTSTPEFLTLPKLPGGWKWVRLVNCWAAEFRGKSVSIETGGIQIIDRGPLVYGGIAPIEVVAAVLKANGYLVS